MPHSESTKKHTRPPHVTVISCAIDKYKKFAANRFNLHAVSRLPRSIMPPPAPPSSPVSNELETLVECALINGGYNNNNRLFHHILPDGSGHTLLMNDWITPNDIVTAMCICWDNDWITPLRKGYWEAKVKLQDGRIVQVWLPPGKMDPVVINKSVTIWYHCGFI